MPKRCNSPQEFERKREQRERYNELKQARRREFGREDSVSARARRKKRTVMDRTPAGGWIYKSIPE